MNQQESDEACKYLSNQQRQVMIEVEMSSSSQATFEQRYSQLTNNYPLPANPEIAPYYVWEPGTNKWGIELRLYFISDENIPTALNDICVVNSRHGYEQFDRRINNNDFIFSLIERGFILGNQDYSRL